ncbi:bifunctional nicotinamidase/pyrazinamidase [Psychroflexus sp. MES1-P1E]|uniref:bifunctional nicotinamidase/pyrazinamidase n=1 Tax=Psychroflexus sp. MES1-P1E TaxID=2058320 RepID=UPI000C7C58FE|nr:bifunctional nicotinamidase/pyrazinamidase [Psychroflexus sp. MES1-P1E]PKG44277.1 bifunctional nicotinamidase/pyrazinamidase [Psychroflexus sp. MES1-P1E]
MKTLLIVDAQLDFMPSGGLAVENGNQIVSHINLVQPQYNLVVATQDWHPQHHISFASNHDNYKPFQKRDIDGYRQTLWPDHCVQGDKGAEFHPNMRTNCIEAIFRKGTDPKIDSYSAFYDNHHTKSTGLAGYLKDKGCTTIDICGLAGDICVYFTIKDALTEGFQVRVLEKATKALDQERFDQQKEELKAEGVVFL